MVIRMINQHILTKKSRQLTAASRRYWLPALIVIGTLAASAALARQPSSRPVLMLIALAGGAVVTALFIKWPELGLLAIVPGSLIVAFSIAAGSQFSTLNPVFLLVMLLLGLWIVKMIVRRRLEFVQGEIREMAPIPPPAVAGSGLLSPNAAPLRSPASRTGTCPAGVR